jgi:hypothetical protein
MNHATNATAHETKIRRWTTFTPPQSTAYAAHCGLVLHRRAYGKYLEAILLKGWPKDMRLGLIDLMRKAFEDAVESGRY